MEPLPKIDPAGDWISFSDKRVKEEIQQYKPVLGDIKKIQVSSYYIKHVGRNKREIGVIAQDMEKYFPEMVSPMVTKKGDTFLGVSYAKTGVLAIKAIQEQQEIIESLEKRIAALEKMLQEKNIPQH